MPYTRLKIAVDSTDAGLGSIVMRGLHNLYYLDPSELLYLDFHSMAYGDLEENIWNRFFHQPFAAHDELMREMISGGRSYRQPWIEAGPWFLGYGKHHDLGRFTQPPFVSGLRRLVGAHLRIRPEILAAFDAFSAAQLAGKKVLGVHKRGSDQLTVGHGAGLYEVINEDFVIRKIDAALSARGCDWIYLATDEQIVVDALTARYGSRLIKYPAEVAPVGVLDAVHSLYTRRAPEFKHALGREMLIDTLALSSVEHALLMTSNVSLLSVLLRRDFNYEFMDAGFAYDKRG